MAERLPSLRALRAFEAVARTGGVRRAAEELHVTHSAVSHQVRTLERDLGTALLHRHGRSISLTDAGTALLPALSEGFHRISEGVAQVRASARISSVVLHVYAIAALRWLNERVPAFRRQHPDITLSYNDRNPRWDFDPASADVGIILERSPLPTGLVQHRLFPGRLYPVCGSESPALEEWPNAEPLDLLEVHDGDWARWRAATGWPMPECARVVRLDGYLIALEMAAAGQGVAMMNGPFADADLRDGRVRLAHGKEAPTDGDWLLVCPVERASDPSVLAVCNWLLAEAAAPTG